MAIHTCRVAAVVRPPRDQHMQEQQLGRGWRTSDEGPVTRVLTRQQPALQPARPVPHCQWSWCCPSPMWPLAAVEAAAQSHRCRPASQPPSASNLEVLTTITSGPSASAGSTAAAPHPTPFPAQIGGPG